MQGTRSLRLRARPPSEPWRAVPAPCTAVRAAVLRTPAPSAALPAHAAVTRLHMRLPARCNMNTVILPVSCFYFMFPWSCVVVAVAYATRDACAGSSALRARPPAAPLPSRPRAPAPAHPTVRHRPLPVSILRETRHSRLTREPRRSHGSLSRSVEGFGKFAAYASAIKSNSCHIQGQPTMFATAGGGGLVSM